MCGLLAAALALPLSGCGASSNVLGLLTPPEHKESFDNLFDVARAAYDRGDLSTALKDAGEAYGFDPDSEKVAVLYGFVNLALAGGDPFTLARALQKQSEKVQSQPTALDEAGGTTSILTTLKQVLALTPDELALMGTMDTSDPALPVLVPGCVEDVRPRVPRLTYLYTAIRVICPFVDEDVRVPGDIHQSCYSTKAVRHQQATAHFLWAFANLTEALAFNGVLTYSTVDPTGQKSNLELRVEKARALDMSTGVAPLLQAMQSVQTTLAAVMPVDGKCSESAPTTQFEAMLADMLAVSAAFQKIPGVPQTLTTQIEATMARIEAMQGDAQAQAFKGDLTKNMAKGLAEKLDSLAQDQSHPLDADEKAQICSAYAQVAAGSGQTSALCDAPPS